MSSKTALADFASAGWQCDRCGQTVRTEDGVCVTCFLREGLSGVGKPELSADAFEQALAEDEIPDQPLRLGNYEVVREIGRGGMAVVYLARRADEQYEKLVAIKLIKRGMDSDAVLRHFRDERQILAGFDHPNIARLFDAGITNDGLSYFVMEYIEGKPINQFCDEKDLSVSERLNLFRQVCGAVSYAHRHLVVHCDLKRSNILVTAEGVPKLLDFGIAKILQQGAEPFVTTSGLRLMTPEYASPEQVRGEVVSTASDVYSLGVVLYELLTGSVPHDFSDQSPFAIARTVGTAEPRKPSTAIRRATGSRAPTRDPGPLRGDLDNITLKALRNESERRYRSVDEFADDIRRYLESRPVLARKDTVVYRTIKFVQRNRVMTAATAVILLSLVAGIVATTWQANRARAQEAIAKAENRRAEKRFNDVRQLAHSVLFDYHDAIKDLPGATRVRERLVADAKKYLDSLTGEANGDPALQRELANAYDRLGDVRGGMTYGANLGDRAGALESYRKSLTIREALAAALPNDRNNRRDLAASYARVGNLWRDTSDSARGLELLRKSLALSNQLMSEQPSDEQAQREVATCYNFIGLALEDRNDLAGALENHRNALSVREKYATARPDNRADRHDLSVTYENIGRVLALKGDLPGALESNSKSMALREALLKTDSANGEYRHLLALSYQNRGDYLALSKDNAGAVQSFRKKLTLDEMSLTADPANAQARDDLGYTCLRLGELLAHAGEYADACSFDDRATKLYEQNIASDPQDLSKRLNTVIAESHLSAALAKSSHEISARERIRRAAARLEATSDEKTNAAQRTLRSQAAIALGDAYSALAVAKGGSENDKRAARRCYETALQILQELQSRGVLSSEEDAQIADVQSKLAIPEKLSAK